MTQEGNAFIPVLSIKGNIRTHIHVACSTLLYSPAFMTLFPVTTKAKGPEARRKEVAVTSARMFLLIQKKLVLH